MSKLGNYLQETKGELKHVSWPTKKQAIAYTLVVIVISFAVAIALGLFDWIFTFGLEKLLNLK